MRKWPKGLDYQGRLPRTPRMPSWAEGLIVLAVFAGLGVLMAWRA